MPGQWQAKLQLMDGQDLPLTFSLSESDSSYAMVFYNGGELLKIDEIGFSGDSIRIRMPVFENYIDATYSKTSMEGSFNNDSRDRRVPFHAFFGKHQDLPPLKKPKADLSGEWEVIFSPGTPDQTYGKGLFTQNGNAIKGTILSLTGDYRYLHGMVSGDSLRISTFDGAHAYLFAAGVSDSLMQGMYYSGNHFKEPFVGRRNPDFKMPDADSITSVEEGYGPLKFTLPDSRGVLYSLDDEKLKNKVVVMQLMGTWCPNCLDETKFLVNYKNQHPRDDLEFIALAFEYAKTREKAFEAIKRLKKQVGVTYPVLLAQYGSADKKTAHRILPMLNQVYSYPTMLFIDKQRHIRRIHTGFNGPATGIKYEDFEKEFDSLIGHLLSE